MEEKISRETLLEHLALLYPFLSSSDIGLFNVKASSSVENFVQAAEKTLTASERRKVVFVGFGPACWRAITCAEVLKRNLSLKCVVVYQRSKISYKSIHNTDSNFTGTCLLGKSLSKSGTNQRETGLESGVESICLLISLDPIPEVDVCLSGVHQGAAAVGHKGHLRSPKLMEAPANPWKRAKKAAPS
uniref:Alba domain-containing protein n=1 Tax=Trichuris muris TaxID=70415 RepID=A0A5S6QTY2_TRIMR